MGRRGPGRRGGAVVGRVILVRTTLAAGAIGLAVLFLAQALISRLRSRGSEHDLRERLRMAGVHSLDEVRAVVLERSGTISILKGERPIDAWLVGDLADRARIPGVVPDPDRG